MATLLIGCTDVGGMLLALLKDCGTVDKSPRATSAHKYASWENISCLINAPNRFTRDENVLLLLMEFSSANYKFQILELFSYIR